METNVQKFSTGAVRGTDAGGERYDLLSPAAMEHVSGLVALWEAATVEQVGAGNMPPFPAVEDHLRVAIGDLYRGLWRSGDGAFAEADYFGFAALSLLWASQADCGESPPLWSADLDHCGRYPDRLPPLGVRAYAEAMAEGAVKYKPFNYEAGMPVHDLVNHAIRHVYLWLSGDRAEDHLGHASWNAMTAVHMCLLRHDMMDGLRPRGSIDPSAEAGNVSTDGPPAWREFDRRTTFLGRPLSMLDEAGWRAFRAVATADPRSDYEEFMATVAAVSSPDPASEGWARVETEEDVRRLLEQDGEPKFLGKPIRCLADSEWEELYRVILRSPGFHAARQRINAGKPMPEAFGVTKAWHWTPHRGFSLDCILVGA